MHEETLDSWDEFEIALNRLRAVHGEIRSKTTMHVSDLVYRGQSDYRWNLATTLQRYTESPSFSLSEYYRKIYSAKAQIETTTQRIWNLITPPEFDLWLEDIDYFVTASLPAYDYLIYLRHHGFPSPLLDWSESPYIAAFFAHNRSSQDTEYVSVYAFLEYTGSGKSYSGNAPYIKCLGPFIRSHERHFIQQCQYTVCTQGIGLETCYADHEEAFSAGEDDQDLLWKFNIPARDRLNVLKRLDTMNINSYSLFRSEDSLMDTMATRTFFLRD